MARAEPEAAAQVSSPPTYHHWLDYIKAIALVWIFFNHVAELLLGQPYIANPSAYWPPLEARIGQLQPLSGHGLLDLPANLLRYIGWAGDQGVQLFIIVSGFGLTWGLLARQAGKPLVLLPFYRRRAKRIYPLWWGAHLLILALSFVLPVTFDPIGFNFVLSLLGIRFTGGTYYYLAPAWWYIGLLIQLYVVYPILWEGLRRRGPKWLFVVTCVVALAIRAVGLVVFTNNLDQWHRGAFFITRLPEFVFGMSLAAWLYRSPEAVDRRLRARSTVIGAVILYIVGMVLSLTLLGMTVAPLMLGAGMFVILYALLARGDSSAQTGTTAKFSAWIGEHSYSLYLIHNSAIVLMLSGVTDPYSIHALIGIVLAGALTLVGAVGLERGVDFVSKMLSGWAKRAGPIGLALRVAVVGLVAAALLLGAELLVRSLAPQEVLGWGERPSLEPHPTFGWRLSPSSETHLRWESYDYTVTANALGFPGPEYPAEKPENAFRILTIGDAFTSAEGVDTSQAWPRLLEAELATQAPDREVQVLNFGVTGYGPNQYAAVIGAYAPAYQPDVIVIGFFVNEYQDVLISDDEFRASIGFDRPAQDGLLSIVSLSHLRQFLSLHVLGSVKELLSDQPNPYGYYLGQFGALERNQPSLPEKQQRVMERLAQIQAVADQVGAQVVILMIPAPVQVCGPDQLSYYPRHIDLADAETFDLELPQRTTQGLAASLDFAYYDLLPALQAETTCPYQPGNLHWTVDGHRVVSHFVAEQLHTDGYLE